MECPMCNGNRSCPECAGLGAVPCDACGGKGGDCAKCNRVGQYECKPCNGSGVCPRCKGEGEVEPEGSKP